MSWVKVQELGSIIFEADENILEFNMVDSEMAHSMLILGKVKNNCVLTLELSLNLLLLSSSTTSRE